MKGVFRRGDGSIVVEEVPPPVLLPNGVLVRVAYSLISSGTEASAGARADLGGRLSQVRTLSRKALRKLAADGMKATVDAARQAVRLRPALQALGYSAAGIVVERDNRLPDLEIGDAVACAGAGYACHQEVIAVPRNLLARVPPRVSLRTAAFATLGSIAMHGVRQAQVQIGEGVLVIGLGLVGQLSAQLLKSAGCRVMGFDRRPERVELALRLGLDLGVDAAETLLGEIRAFTRGIGADAVLLCADTVSSDPVRLAIEAARERGRIVVVGVVGLQLDRQSFYEKELVLTIARSYGPGRYDPLYEEEGIDYPIGYVRWTEQRNLEAFLRLAGEGRVTTDPLIGLEVPVEEAPRAYAALQTEPRPVAVLLRYQQAPAEALVQRKVPVHPRPVRKDLINVGVIGCGGFAQAVRLPALQQVAGFHLRAVVTATGVKAKEAARRFSADYCTTDYREVLVDEEIDMVLIATQHHLHQPIALEAARAGKAIFLEKPMGLSWEECVELAGAVEQAEVPFTMGFNRRYSRLAVAAKALLSRRQRPYVVLYRVNAGPVPPDNWVQDPDRGGGRIIGETCHFFDFFNFLIEDEVTEVQARGVPGGGAVAALDNAAATVRYRDGSLATLIYTSLGDPGLPKERVEVFAEGGSLVLDDFRSLTPYGFDARPVALPAQDKGFRRELEEFLKRQRGEPSASLSPEEALAASRVTFQVHALVYGGTAEGG